MKMVSGTETVRRPAVAGYFYPKDRQDLQRTIERLRPLGAAPRAARAAIVPHGSYDRCGGVIGSTLGQIEIPRRCVIIGPSHTGSWMPWNLLSGGSYRTPLGDVPIDAEMAHRLRQRCSFLYPGEGTQQGEHAIEVVLPFLQHLGPGDLAVMPVLINSDQAEELQQFTSALADVVQDTPERVLLIASTDLTHFQSVEQTRLRDVPLIQWLCGLDTDALLRHVHGSGASMCGYAAAAAVTGAAKMLGAAQGVLTQYATSADTDGDPDSAVGYAGIIIE